MKQKGIFAAACMDFKEWRRSYRISLEEIAQMSELPLEVVQQVDQGHCATLAVAQRLRIKLYHYYENPVMLNWVFFDGDPGGLPDWWWRFSWEEPNHMRVSVLVPAENRNDANDRYCIWMEKHRLPWPISTLLTELGELPETFPELYPHQPGGRREQTTEQWWRLSWEDPHHVRASVLIPAKQLSNARDLCGQWIQPLRLPTPAEEQFVALGTLQPEISALYPSQPDYYRPLPIFDD